jgi:hypothetical protein
MGHTILEVKNMSLCLEEIYMTTIIVIYGFIDVNLEKNKKV